MSTSRFVLFVPQHQGGGTGEFFRLLTVATALHAADASVRIEFLMPKACRLRPLLPFPHTESDLPDEQRQQFHARELARLKPTIVVFDKTCRGSMLRLCRRLKIRSVCISDEPGTCGKTFRADWLWSLDEHWHQRYLLGRPAFSAWQRLLARISSTRRVLFDVCQLEDAVAALAPSSPYLLFVPGGGTYRIDGRTTAELFIEAADRVARATGMPVLAIGQAVSGEEPGDRRVTVLPPQPQGQLIALMRGATIVVTGGGHLINQAISVRVPTVSMPLGGSDQSLRVDDFASRGWTVAAQPQVDDIADKTLQLLGDTAALQTMRERLQTIEIIQGVPLMVESLLRRL
ncbi:hypothetical protein [uncultured Nevskia sp.]|uniref:hypothetical protein n=1 Tax=uncultured Nevskia sp. TaxID=228950 RepID=UPI0025CBDCAD|nr:hypothetical protein [uncultured Nevskia sp.]